MTLELTVMVFEPLRLTLPIPVGWSTHPSDKDDSLVVVGTDDLGNDALNPSITVNRKGPSVPWGQLAKLADGSLGEMRSSYREFHLHSSREIPEHDRVVRAYSYVHDDLGPVGQVQGLIDADGVVLVTCSAPKETFNRLVPTFEKIVTGVEHVNPDDIVEEPEPDEG